MMREEKEVVFALLQQEVRVCELFTTRTRNNNVKEKYDEIDLNKCKKK